MRLIDADKLMEDIEVLKKQIHKITRDINYITPTRCESVDTISRMCECIMMELNAFEKAYKNIPTAFDVDKVVEQLEIEKYRLHCLKNDCIALSDKEVYAIENKVYNKAIEIVKEGWIDE